MLKMFLSVYENKIEKRIDKVIGKIKLGKSSNRLKDKFIVNFLENPIEMTVWLEYKYKGYKFLKKRKRRHIYEVAELIEEDFMSFYESEEINFSTVEMTVPDRLKNKDEKENIWKLMMIAKFLKGKFKYRESSAFWKLFPNDYGDEDVKMIGDCNQIVTVYIWLYRLIGELEDLKIRVLPKHVCLHLHDLDFEATNGQFKDYKKKGYIAECENIVSINLLDIHDPVEQRWDVSEVNTAKMQAVAAMFDVETKLVENNLKITYANMGVFYMNTHKWKTARKYLEMAESDKMIEMSYHNEVVELLENNNFKKAIKVAHRGGLETLEMKVRRDYCIRLTKSKNWKKAFAEARKLGDKKMLKYVYGKEFEYLYDKVSEYQTVSAARNHKTRYRRLLFLARKLGDKKAEECVKKILRKI